MEFQIQTPEGLQNFSVENGETIFFVGPNGGGKTRLAVRIEDQLGAYGHRISAHRSLNLNPEVAKISEASALKGLRIGATNSHVNISSRTGSRWRGNAETSLLNDFDFLVQALFAEQSNRALDTHNRKRANEDFAAEPTRLETLSKIWSDVLPHRKLIITGDDIRVAPKNDSNRYSASELSDGERSVFYLIGQVLTAEINCLLVFDEPELHIHRSVLTTLWDQIQTVRHDCSFVFISHDLEFVASRIGQKYLVKEFSMESGWDIEAVPETGEFPEEMVTMILGSRRPILFVEGGLTSLDRAVFRACFPDWHIVPRNSCGEVIHAVVTMRQNSSLTRVACAGIVDGDAYSQEQILYLQQRGIHVLCVAQIENLFLLPDVLAAILETDGHSEASMETLRDSLLDKFLLHPARSNNRQRCILESARRRIDLAIKVIDLSSANSSTELDALLHQEMCKIDTQEIIKDFETEFDSYVSAKAIEDVLRLYDNKGVLEIAAEARGTTVSKFKDWVLRIFQSSVANGVVSAIKRRMPVLTPPSPP
jgi:energy-coupling factor transporter ATP-binding protein EcfA2